MGTGYHGGFGKTNIDDNAELIKNKYPFTKSGYFGKKGKNARIIYTDTPIKTSKDFYDKLSKGGTKQRLSNGKGTLTLLDDYTVITYRIKTSTKGSPAVDIHIIGNSQIKSQKIHFIKEENKNG